MIKPTHLVKTKKFEHHNITLQIGATRMAVVSLVSPEWVQIASITKINLNVNSILYCQSSREFNTLCASILLTHIAYNPLYCYYLL